MQRRQRQRGAFLVLAALLLAVLLGTAALAIDVGRLYALRAEMQNAVDAAALAAAAELDAGPDARARAIAAARDLLQHDSRFARTRDLLGAAGLPAAAFAFYCLIGAKYDPPYDPQYCSNAPDGDGRASATSDAEAHYVAVVLDPAQTAAGDRFRLDLIFLPVLSAVGVATPVEAAPRARALAGRNAYTCNVPPVAICDPFEGSGTTFRDAMNIGDGIQLRSGGSNQWTNGNFGFLQPPNGASGANALAQLLADENSVGCFSPYVTTEPGAMAQATTRGINTRFDDYSGNFNNGWSQYPPAPNVVSYPHDSTWRSLDDRFGTGDWDFEAYWAAAHPGLTPPNTWSSLNRPSRWAVYNWELDNAQVPNAPPTYAGRPLPSHVSAGSRRERRVFTVAVLSCNALDLGGRSGGPVREPDGYARIFLYRKADGPPDLRAWGEFIGWDDGGSEKFHVDLQLYE